MSCAFYSGRPVKDLANFPEAGIASTSAFSIGILRLNGIQIAVRLTAIPRVELAAGGLRPGLVRDYCARQSKRASLGNGCVFSIKGESIQNFFC